MKVKPLKTARWLKITAIGKIMKYIVNSYRKNEYLKYSLWFCICIAIVFLPFHFMGRSLIDMGDSFNQSFPLFVYIGQWLRACLRGEIRLFDFRLGLGDDVIYALNWHGFGDITQVLSAVVPYEYAEYAYNFVMILKLWLCGLSFLVYIKKYVNRKEYRVVGALLYACNTYTLAWGLNCWMFLAPMMTFPLVLAGIDTLCNEKKSFSIALLAGVWIQSLNGFYFLYMEAILAILYFGIEEFNLLQNLQKRWKKLLDDVRKILFESLLAVGLGAPLLIPSFMGYLQSSRTGNSNTISDMWELLIYPFDFYRRVLSSLLIPNIYSNIFTLGYIVIIGIGVTFMHKSDKHRVHRQLFVLFGILYCIPFWGKLMNGFSGSTDRWLFGFVLIAISLAVMGLESETILSRKERIVIYLLVGVLIIMYLTDSDWYSGKIFTVLAYGAIGAILSFIYNKREKCSKIILPMCVFLIIINGLLIFVSREMGGSGYVWGFKAKGVTKMEVDQSIDVIEKTDQVFERKDVFPTSLGASLIKNFYGTTEYLSTLNGNSSEFYRELYIDPGVFGTTWVLKGLDGRTELEALCSVTQFMEYTGDDFECVYRFNDAYLPLGITYQSWISRDQFNQLTPMEKEAVLIRYVVLENKEGKVLESVRKVDEIDKEIFEADSKVASTLSWKNIIQNGKEFYAGEDAVVRVYLDDSPEYAGKTKGKELYVQLQNMCLLDEGTADICVGNKKIQMRNADDDYYMGVDEFWVNVTELRYDQKGCYFDIKLPEGKKYCLGDVAVYQHKIDYTAIDERKENALEQLEVGINRVSGTVCLEDSAAMLFTIPYGKGWKAYVDGVEQPVYKADVGFLAIELSAGSHTVVLKYMTPGLFIGCMCSALSVLILIAIWRKKHCRRL